jgi:hypothetical protein
LTATDDELIAASRRLLDDPTHSTVSAWARAAALLARQALEHALAGYWAVRLPGAERLTMRAQLNCAHMYLGRQLAGGLTYTWYALSRATHHHPYELDPTREELASLIESASLLVKALAVNSGSATAPGAS